MSNFRRPKADDEDRWIDVHDHDLMVYLGMQQPYYEGRDPSIWTKTPKEKALLKQMKARCTTILPSRWPAPDKVIPIASKLIIRVRPSNKYRFIDKKHNIQKKTYFSKDNVLLTDIPRILAQYYVWKKDLGRQSLVISYIWNGKKYNYGELPKFSWK